ncbi:MAG: PQQ-binding-like beta-propeller repeat protein, partial [Actinomycetota bacterium]
MGPRVVAVAVLALLAASCGSAKPGATKTTPTPTVSPLASGAPPSPAQATSGATSPSAAPSTAASPAAGHTSAAPPPSPAAASFANWTVFGGDVAHSGVAPGSAPAAAAPTPGWSSAALDGDDHGQPIIAGGKVIAATENDTVYAFSASTGAQLWSTHVGSPEVASALPCGDINPYTGITSTPVVDVPAGLVYVVAFLRSGSHTLFALDLSTGAIAWSKPADGPGLNPLTEQQRAGLVLANGYVYLSYGGLYGDCGTYHGAVVGIPASGSGATISY